MTDLETTFKNDMTHYICPDCSDTHWTEDGARDCCDGTDSGNTLTCVKCGSVEDHQFLNVHPVGTRYRCNSCNQTFYDG